MQGQQQALKHPHNPAYIDLYWILIKWEFSEAMVMWQ